MKAKRILVVLGAAVLLMALLSIGIFAANTEGPVGTEAGANIFKYTTGGKEAYATSGTTFSSVVYKADAGSTVYLLADYEFESSANGYLAYVEKDLTIDLGGHTMTIKNRYDNATDYGQPRIGIKNKVKLTVKNGTLVAGHITSAQCHRAYPFFQFASNGAELELDNVNTYFATLVYSWGNYDVKVNVKGGEHHSIFSSYGCDGGYINSRAGMQFYAEGAKFYISSASTLVASAHQNDGSSAKKSSFTFSGCDIITATESTNLVKYSNEYTTIAFNGCNIYGGVITPTVQSGDVNKGIGEAKAGSITLGHGTRLYKDIITSSKYVECGSGLVTILDQKQTAVTLKKSSGNLMTGMSYATVTDTYATSIYVGDPTDTPEIDIRWYDTDGKLITTTRGRVGTLVAPPELTEYKSAAFPWCTVIYNGWATEPGGNAGNTIVTNGGAFYLTRGDTKANLSELSYNLKLMGHVQINLYVPIDMPSAVSDFAIYKTSEAAELGTGAATSSTTTEIGGRKYAAYTAGWIGATTLDRSVTVYIKYNVLVEGEKMQVYTPVSLSPISYVKRVLADSESAPYSFEKSAHELCANIVRYSKTLCDAVGISAPASLTELYDKYVIKLLGEIDNTTDDDFSGREVSVGNLGECVYSITFELTAYQPRFMLVFKPDSKVTDMRFSFEGWTASYYASDVVNWNKQSFGYNTSSGVLYYDSYGQYVNTSGVVCDAYGNALPDKKAGTRTDYIAVAYTDNIQIYNIDSDMTVTVTAGGNTYTGMYNINSYYNGVKDHLDADTLAGVRLFLKSMRAYGDSVIKYRFSAGKYPTMNEDGAVLYSDFGAVGDGVTDDLEAIKAAHSYANTFGLKVKATEGAVYYIGNIVGAVTVKTDTDWTGAKFIIDDTVVSTATSERTKNIFNIVSDASAVTYTAGKGEIGARIDAINAAGGINKNDFTTLDLGLGYKAMVMLINDDHRCYIRYGINQDNGSSQNELVLIDENGNVDPSTPLLFSYEKITKIKVIRVDDKPITVTGGDFETRANIAPREYTYYGRGILISRSNVTITNISHIITGEGDTGAPYSGFVNVQACNNVLIKDSVLSAHKAYKLITNENNTMGTYDLSFSESNAVTCYNVTMHNFFASDGVTPSVDAGYWGIMGSNYCKNLTYDSCKLTRFDAHKGTYNATIRDSDVASLTLIGGGTFTMENSRVYTNGRSYIIGLRSDYGSTWNGDFIIKNVTAVTKSAYTSGTMALINGGFTNHNFGYTCYMPANVVVDNLTVTAKSVKTIVLANGSIAREGVSSSTYEGAENINPYVITKTLTIKNNAAGYTFTLPTPSDFMSVTVIREK